MRTGYLCMNNDGMGIYSFLQPVADVISKVIDALYQEIGRAHV